MSLIILAEYQRSSLNGMAVSLVESEIVNLDGYQIAKKIASLVLSINPRSLCKGTPRRSPDEVPQHRSEKLLTKLSVPLPIPLNEICFQLARGNGISIRELLEEVVVRAIDAHEIGDYARRESDRRLGN